MSQVAPDTHQIDDEARPGAWAADTSLDVIEVVGPDAVGYLQGQLSQNVSGLAVGAWAPSLLLEPQGKMCAWMRVHRAAGDSVDLVVDAGFGSVVEEHLKSIGMIVDAVTEVLSIDSMHIDTTKSISDNDGNRFIGGIGNIDGRLVIMLNLDEIIDLPGEGK